VSPAAVLLALSVLLTGCGGGFYIGIGPDDDAPDITLSADTAAAPPGAGLVLTAQARDDDFVVEVTFYRLEPSGAVTFLCNDRVPAYHCSTPIPALAAPGSTVSFIARATDSVGQSADSEVLGVVVQ
jgi:hypothetical protein